ncbi:hypothetical protein BGW80DRAFT_1196763 [Lactifluus volemus]|nr:hypothetical protein BGW80DRAFT_1196763 [Lactifluus volemus]
MGSPAPLVSSPLPSLTPSLPSSLFSGPGPSQAPSRASSIGPIRRERGSLTPGGESFLEGLVQVNGAAQNFRFSSKNYFITWSQIGDIPNEELEAKLASFGDKIEYWAAAEEHHQDGGRHWHAFLHFRSIFRGRDASVFDIGGIYPNIKSSKGTRLNQKRIWLYLNKEGRVIMGPWKGPPAEKAALEAPTKEDFFSCVRAADPKVYITCYDKLEYYSEKHYAPPIPVFTPKFTEFVRVPQEMQDWLRTEFTKTDHPKTLVVWGPSRTGKTSWARSLGEHSYLGSAWNVEEVIEDKEYIIFDDIPFEMFMNWQAFLGAQDSFTITDKYKRKRTIRNWNKPCIWLNNKNPIDCTPDQWKKDWLMANCVFVNLEHRLYLPSPIVPEMFQPQPRWALQPPSQELD